MVINFPSKHGGQSLVEVLVTVLIIAVSVSALIRFQNYLSYDNALTKQKNEATILGQKQLETFLDFQVLTNTSGYTSYQSIATGSASSTVNGTAYTIGWTVTSYTFPTYKNVNISVSWIDRRGVSQSTVVNSDVAGIEPAFSALIF